MTTFVLVHGAWHGAWCWHRIVPRLAEEGHDAVAIDLPAHGTDTTPPDEVTLHDYVDRIGSAIDDADGPVVLVGHSMAGIPISQTAEARPDDVERLVYLTAFLPDDGESLLDHATTDEGTTVEQVIDEERGVSALDPSTVRAGFYHDCRDADVALCRALLRPEPLAPLAEPVDLSEERYGSVDRVYVRCDSDRAITPSKQREMLDARPCDEVALETSHSPFLSAPDELAAVLLDVGSR